MQKLNPNTEISRSESYLDTQLDDESIVMQIESGNIYGMGETAKTIWDIIAQPISFSSIVENLMVEYKVGREKCESEASKFFLEMEKFGLVVISTRS